MLRLFAVFSLAIACLLPCFRQTAEAKSAMSPRHSGMEPPGGPRQLDVIPGNSPGRTAEGGMGYTDAYGRTLTDIIPEERKPRHRPRPGAYGAPKKDVPPLPDPARDNSPPVWNFR